ncbi:glycosyltransferase family 2 protein [Lysobacter sp. 2RAB21]
MIETSVVIPAYRSAKILPQLAQRLQEALDGMYPDAGGEQRYQVILVNDCSPDDTWARLEELSRDRPWLQGVNLRKNAGQHNALLTGLRYARGRYIIMMDDDLQHDPADIPKLLAKRAESGPEVKLFAGWRVNRQDSGSKRWASKWANAIRSRMLRDDTPDTGCGIKLFERAAFMELPYFDHMHRYLPALMQRAGWKTLSVPVNHRQRSTGVSKYNNLNRALVGISDLRGVAWLIRRGKLTQIVER